MAKWFSDLGHGGNDPGAVGSGKRESDIVLAAGLEFKRIMEANGEIVKLSRTSDTALSLTERTNMANSWGADYVVSKHVNAAGATAKGTETFIYRDSGNTVDNKSKKLAQLCNKHTLNAIKEMEIAPVDRGVKVENLHMVRETIAPACLVELDFISNPNIAPKLNGTIYGKHLAYACLEMVGKKVGNSNNNNNNNNKPEEDDDMKCSKYAATYCNEVDKEFAEVLGKLLPNCHVLDARKSTNWRNMAEVLIAVGADNPNKDKPNQVGFSGYTNVFIKGKDRDDTLKKVYEYAQGK